MRPPFEAGDLAALAQVPVSDIHAYRDAGLLDPDGDGTFDDLDVLRLRLVLHHRDLGQTIEEIAQGIRDRTLTVLYADLLYGSAEGYTVEEAAERVGLSAEQVRVLRRAVGFPGTLLGDRDLEMLSTVRMLMDGGLPWDAVLEAARVYGDALRRLADTEIRIFQDYVNDRVFGARDDRERAERVQFIAETFQGMLDRIIQHIHRRHMLRAAAEDAMSMLESQEPGGARGEREATIVFVDLASFTPLAQVHGDEVAARVLERFDSLVREVLGERKGSIVKQIGDAFMLTFAEPVEAVRFALALDEAAGAEPRFPAIRGGIHAGKVLYRVGDYVGNTVNLASRIAAMAAANEILMTKPVAQAANEADVPVEPAGQERVRGLSEPVPLWRLGRTGRATRRERDPVCGMIVGADAAARLLHGGFEFAFCSEECLRLFLEHPTRYTEPEPEGKPVL